MKKPEPCSIPGCWQDARTAGLCGACYSGMYRLRTLSVLQITHYIKRVDRLKSRAGAFGHKGMLRNVVKFRRKSA